MLSPGILKCCFDANRYVQVRRTQTPIMQRMGSDQTLLSPSFMPTISYSPAPSLPLPLPLPRDSPPSSSAAGCGCGCGRADVLLPKLMGLNSRHWHAHIPKEVMMVALHICSAHQKRFAGIACVYKEVTTKCMKCTVRAKSRTSLERAMRSSMKMALWHVRRLYNSTERVGEGLPGEAIQHPDQAQCPSNRGIPAQALPVEEEI